MRTTTRTSALVLGSAILLACADATSAPRNADRYGDLTIAIPQLATLPQPDTRLYVSHMLIAGDSSYTQSTSDGTTPSWVTNRDPGLITVHWTDAGFSDTTSGWAEAYMKYWATNADQILTMNVRYNNSGLPSSTSHDAADDLIPWSRELRTDTSIGINAACGFALDATGTHSVGMKFIASGAQGWLEWGKSTVSDTHSAAQAACGTNSGGSSQLGTSGGGYVVCYYWIYYDSAGNYAGSSEYFGCYFTHHELG